MENREIMKTPLARHTDGPPNSNSLPFSHSATYRLQTTDYRLQRRGGGCAVKSEKEIHSLYAQAEPVRYAGVNGEL